MAIADTKKKAPTTVTIAGRAYAITDHSFDVVVVGAGLLKTLLWICVSSFPSSRPNPKETAIAPSNDA